MCFKGRVYGEKGIIQEMLFPVAEKRGRGGTEKGRIERRSNRVQQRNERPSAAPPIIAKGVSGYSGPAQQPFPAC